MLTFSTENSFPHPQRIGVVILAIESFEFRLEKFNKLINEFAEMLSKEEEAVKVEEVESAPKSGGLNGQLIKLYNENNKMKQQLEELKKQNSELKEKLKDLDKS